MSTSKCEAWIINYLECATHKTLFSDSRSRPPLAPEDPEEIIDVDDENNERGHDERKWNSKMRRSSPDELNLSSQPSSTSKYFPESNMQRKGRHTMADLAPDGPDTIYLRNYYNGCDSDPIEEASDPPLQFLRRGHVKAAVDRLNQIAPSPNQITPSPKINLFHVQKKPPGKASRMKPKVRILKAYVHRKSRANSIKFSYSQSGRTTSEFKANGGQSDRVAEPTTLPDKHRERGPLPVEALFLDHDFYPQSKGQKVELFWTTNSNIIIKANESKVYSLHLTPASCKSPTVSQGS